MRYKISIEYKDDYIHVSLHGSDDRAASPELWQRIAESCEQYNCYNILGESYNEENLSTLDGYDHIEIFERAGITLKHRIAWVHHVKETVRGIKFVETVLRNRALMNGGLFESVEEAKRWLMGKENGE